MAMDKIAIKGARANNLKNDYDITIPRDKLVVLTGLSGSGSLPWLLDTIYAEGAKTLCGITVRLCLVNSWPRAINRMLDGSMLASPAISIDQKTTSRILVQLRGLLRRSMII